MPRTLVTSAIPYINGIKHLGNLVGSQLPADLYARGGGLRGDEVLFLCATDEHGTPAELAAAKAGKPVAEYCARDVGRPEGHRPTGSACPSTISGGRPARRTTRLTQHFAGEAGRERG